MPSFNLSSLIFMSELHPDQRCDKSRMKRLVMSSD
jgi:hypothetical protein